MTYSRNRVDQEDIEDELFYQSSFAQIQLVLGVIQSSTFYRNLVIYVYRTETLLFLCSLIILLLSLARYDRSGRVHGWFRGITTCTLVSSFYLSNSSEKGDAEWSEVTDCSVTYSMQGRRPGNEDRAFARTVDTDEGNVRIFAVLDGHGGEFAVNYVKQELLQSLETVISQLKLISSSQLIKTKVLTYEENFGPVPDCVKTHLKISEAEYQQIIPKSRTEESSPEDESSSEEKSANNNAQKSAENDNEEKSGESEEPEVKTIPRNQLVLSCRRKSLEELPIPKPVKTPKPTRNSEKKGLKLNSKQSKGKPSKSKGSQEKEAQITDYIGGSGEILYAQLIKDQILECDKNLLKAAKKAKAIGGTTVVLSILDGRKLWVGNVGDSRGVFCTENGQAIPLSFDHKPCQLKEKRRIQEAGGFVSLNGVWRVQGVLATSRALGDFPLKDKNVIVADPDVLSFNIQDHKMEFIVLATDGLWDTHTNEEVIESLRSSSRDYPSVRSLAQEAYVRGSTDNITILLANINKINS